MLSLFLAAPGCTVWRQARRTLCTEPTRFSAAVDRKRSLETYRSWAERAWKQECQTCGTMTTNDTYKAGFSDGFTDYVYAGGTGEPPPVPPREFWNLCERSPAGAAAAADWFAGYRHGARVARAGGYRQRGVVISSLAPYGDGPPAVDGMLMAPEAIQTPGTTLFEGEVLGPPMEDYSAEGANAPSPPAAIQSPEEGFQGSPADELPAPQLQPTDETTQRSASEFKSVLLSAAERRQAKTASSLPADGIVERAVASESIPPEADSSEHDGINTLRARSSED